MKKVTEILAPELFFSSPYKMYINLSQSKIGSCDGFPNNLKDKKSILIKHCKLQSNYSQPFSDFKTLDKLKYCLS